jgi:hypothetical protein
MSSAKFDTRGYSEAYLRAREAIDELCGEIAGGKISRDEAMQSYSLIESDYLKEDPQNAELFKMVYESRVVRLLRQFGSGVRDES